MIHKWAVSVGDELLSSTSTERKKKSRSSLITPTHYK